MGYYNVSPNYKLSTSTISKSLLESTRFNQWISMESEKHHLLSILHISQSASISVLPPPLPPPPAATMASLYLWRLCMCITSKKQRTCVNVCMCACMCECMLDHIIAGPWNVWRVSISAWDDMFKRGLFRLIKFSHFDFWELSLPLSLSLSSHHLGVCWVPSLSLHYAPFTGGTVLASRSHRKRHLFAATSEHPHTLRNQLPSPCLQRREDGETSRERAPSWWTDWLCCTSVKR